VVIGLAADSWRQSLWDQRSEVDYLERIRADLQDGRTLLEQYRTTFQETQRAAQRLAQALESEQPPYRRAALVDDFVSSARTGFVEANITHDRAYRELAATGRLSLLRDRALREDLTQYYTGIDQLVQSLLDMPQGVRERFMRLTGYSAVEYRLRGRTLSEEEERRLLRELDSEAAVIIRELRETHARLEMNLRRLSQAIDDVDALSKSLE